MTTHPAAGGPTGSDTGTHAGPGSGTVGSVVADHVLLADGFAPARLVLRDGLVAAIEPLGATAPGADRPATAGGRELRVPGSAYVVPGVVDTHVHVNEPGRTSWEGFASATRAAALGGVTTLVDMPLNAIPPTTTLAGLHAKQAAARGQLAVDVGLWGGAVPGNLEHLEPLWEAGVFGFKCFLSPSGVEEFPPLDGEEFLAALRRVAAFDGLVVVHAEDPAVLAAAPARPGRAYADFLLSRPDASEVAAIRRVVDGARETGCRVHVLHLSSARALGLLADARAEGLPVTVETCPHYLCLAAEAIPDGAPEYKCCPPIRDSGNRDELWAALVDGVVDCVVSDHSPATAEEKQRGGGDLQQAWGGVSGLQVGLAAVAQEARRRGIGLDRVSAWMSAHTADLVGLSARTPGDATGGTAGGTAGGPRGRIEVGAVADLAVYDTAAPLTVDAADLAHRNPVSAYHGLHLAGSVTRTVVGGRLVDAAAGLGPRAGGGRLLRRA